MTAIQNTADHTWLARDELNDGPIQNIAYWLNQTGYSPVTIAYSVLSFGAVGNGTTDDTAAIQGGLLSGRRIYFPEGYTFAVTQLVLNSLSDIVLEGGGLILGTNRAQGIVKATSCARIKFLGLQVQHQTPGARTGAGGIWVLTSTDVEVAGCEVSSQSGVGIYMQGNTRYRVHHNIVHDTGADGIANTCTGSSFSAQFAVDGNVLFNTGDDSISVTSPTTASGQCQDFAITGNVSLNSKARGVCVAGGLNGTVTGNTIDASSASGIILVANNGDLGINNVAVIGNSINLANSYNSPGSVQPSISVFTPQSLNPIDGVLIAGNRIGKSTSWYIEAQGPGGGGGILNLAIKGNHCEGPMQGGSAGDAGIFLILVDSATVSDNDIWLPNGNGITVQSTCAFAITTNNKIYHPNQGNSANQYGVNNGATNGANWGNLIVPDAGKTALAANELCSNPTYAVPFSAGPVLAGITSPGVFTIQPSGVSNTALELANQGSAVNGYEITGTNTGAGPILASVGSDTNIPIVITAKGTAGVQMNAANLQLSGGVFASSAQVVLQPSGVSNAALDAANNASAVNGLKVTGTATAVTPVLSAIGSDTNIGIVISGKGTGGVSTTSVFFPVQATTVGAPAYVAGGMYYDTTLNKLRIGGAAGWETVTSA